MEEYRKLISEQQSDYVTYTNTHNEKVTRDTVELKAWLEKNGKSLDEFFASEKYSPFYSDASGKKHTEKPIDKDIKKPVDYTKLRNEIVVEIMSRDKKRITAGIKRIDSLDLWKSIDTEILKMYKQCDLEYKQIDDSDWYQSDVDAYSYPPTGAVMKQYKYCVSTGTTNRLRKKRHVGDGGPMITAWGQVRYTPNAKMNCQPGQAISFYNILYWYKKNTPPTIKKIMNNYGIKSEACIKPDMSNLPLCDDVESNLKSGSSLKHISDNIYYGTGKDGCPFKCRK